MPYRPADFRSTVVKPYYKDESTNYDITITVELRTQNEESTSIVEPDAESNIEQATKPVKKRGRSRPRKNTLYSAAYITAKEKADYNLSLKLR